MSGIAPADLEQVATGIFYTRLPFVVAGGAVVEFLKHEAGGNGIGRARVCAHPSAEAEQHDIPGLVGAIRAYCENARNAVE